MIISSRRLIFRTERGLRKGPPGCSGQFAQCQVRCTLRYTNIGRLQETCPTAQRRWFKKLVGSSWWCMSFVLMRCMRTKLILILGTQAYLLLYFGRRWMDYHLRNGCRTSRTRLQSFDIWYSWHASYCKICGLYSSKVTYTIIFKSNLKFPATALGRLPKSPCGHTAPKSSKISCHVRFCFLLHVYRSCIRDVVHVN